jgi:hypothetical protein
LAIGRYSDDSAWLIAIADGEIVNTSPDRQSEIARASRITNQRSPM